MRNWQIIKEELKRWGFYNWLFALLVMLPVAIIIAPLKLAGLLGGLIEMAMLKVAFKIPVKKP
jgi:cobalamin biosynthesis protein CobD/CbiB